MALSPVQIRAAELLAKGHSHQSVGTAVGVSRRTIIRWLKQDDFKNLSFGLISRPSPSLKPSERPSESPESKKSLTADDLVGDALLAVQGILRDPDARNGDRLSAARLVGEWSYLSRESSKMHELEAVKVLIDAGWIPDEVLDALIDGGNELSQRVRNAFQSVANSQIIGDKKSLPQLSGKGFNHDFDDDFDDEDDI